MKYLLFAILIITCTICNSVISQTLKNNFQKTITAVRVDTAPVIDGVLDDIVWGDVPIASDFVQNSPNPGKQASQKTEVKIIYDNEALYVYAVMYDVSKDSIIRQYSQRDEEDNTDVFGIFLDTYNDHQNGYAFVVHPTGVQYDARYSNQQGQDVTWNAVWQSEVTIDEHNWYVEMKIPYSAIRFAEKDVQEWGINFARKIRRIREFSYWNEVNPEVNGLFNQFGTVEGIEGIEAPMRLMFMPYVSAYAEHYPYNVDGASNFSTSFNGGMDLKYGINDAFTLDMTLIPDFGQVQSDNQVLNLTPFEVEFDENRPFFMEGTELFNKGGLFYSRRLGSRPSGYFDAYDGLGENEEVTTNPDKSQLVNATKISGRTEKGLGIGVFNGVTKNMYATIRDTITGGTREVMTDPLTNYNVLVFDQSLKNNSYVTLINTNVMRSGATYDANVTGGLFKFNTKSNDYFVSGLGVLSQKYIRADSVALGHNMNLAYAKVGGNFNFGVDYYERSDSYDPNDLGYLYNNNARGGSAYIGYNTYEPSKVFINTWSSLTVYYERLYNPNEFVNFAMTGEYGGTFKNWLSSAIYYTAEPIETYDYFEPRVWGRYYSWQSNHDVGGWISSDYRKRIALDINSNYRWFSTDGRYRYNLTVSPRFRFSDRFSMVYSISRYYNANDEGAAVALNGGGTIVGNDIIFGKRDQTTFENILNLNYIFTNRMGLTFRMRHYWSKVDYNSFHILDQQGQLLPSSYTGVDGESNSLHDTNFNAFNIDMVYRWVFAPGSEISVVYKTSLLTFGNDVAESYGTNFQKTLQSPQTQSLSVKVLYYIDYLSLKRKRKKM